MKVTDIHQAEADFPKLVERAINGEEVIIAKDGKPVAKLTRWETPKATARGGQWRGKVWVSDDFDAPLPAEIQKAFEGRRE
jgi:antitoxin (DNA-binding transcriptional repressor) of toxin-antitoxin stability system